MENKFYEEETRGSVGIGALYESGQLHRSLGNRQIQLIAIGGSIGTAIFVSIAFALVKGGPASLLLAYFIYSFMVGLVNNCMAEMAVWHPIGGGFIRMAGHWVDPAFGFLAGWNFWIYEAINIPFEISAVNFCLRFWRDDIPVPAVVSACIVLYLYVFHCTEVSASRHDLPLTCSGSSTSSPCNGMARQSSGYPPARSS
jgi:amino acid transporter